MNDYFECLIIIIIFGFTINISLIEKPNTSYVCIILFNIV